LHLVDATYEDAGAAYKTVRTELKAYSEELAAKPEIVALSKADAMTPERIEEQLKSLKKASKKTPLVISAHSRQGVAEVLRALLDIIDDARKKAGEEPDTKVTAWQP
jgi:GTP-binding protein